MEGKQTWNTKKKQVRFSVEIEQTKISQIINVPESANHEKIIERLEDWARGQLLLYWGNVE